MTFFGVAAFLATTAFFGTVCFGAAFFAATFFAATFFAAGFFAGKAFLAGGFATALETADVFFDFTAGAGLRGVFFAADLATERPAFAVVLLAFSTTFPFAAVVFDAAALTPFALLEALSFCALALELPVVFAISLHRGWPWRPGVIAHVSFTSKPDSGILVTLHPSEPFRQRESSDQIDTVVAPFVQALDQSIAWSPVPIPSQLLRLCTDCGRPLWPLARKPPHRLAAPSLPALMHGRRRPSTRTLPLRSLSLQKRRV